MLASSQDEDEAGAVFKHESLGSEPSVTYCTQPGKHSTDGDGDGLLVKVAECVTEPVRVTVTDSVGDGVNVADRVTVRDMLNDDDDDSVLPYDGDTDTLLDVEGVPLVDIDGVLVILTDSVTDAVLVKLESKLGVPEVVGDELAVIEGDGSIALVSTLNSGGK